MDKTGLAQAVTTRGFKIRGYSFPPGHALDPHRHDAPALVAVLHGSYQQTISGREYEFGRGTVVSVPAGDLHSEVVGDAGVESVLIWPRTEALDLGDSLEDILERFHFTNTALQGTLVTQLGYELRSADITLPLAVEAIVTELLALMMGGAAEATHTGPPWLHRLRELLDEEFSSRLTLSLIAREVGVSPAHMSRQFRQAFGTSVWVYVRHRRLEEVARLLRETDASLSAVALRSGFYDQSHMGGAFRRTFGTTPKEYRATFR